MTQSMATSTPSHDAPTRQPHLAAYLARLASPPPLPRRWAGLCAGLCALVFAGLMVAIYTGWRDHEWPAHHLQDNHWGTLLSVVPLTAAGILGIVASRRRIIPSGHRTMWLIAGIALLVTAADDLLRLHENFEVVVVAVLDLNPEQFLTKRINDAVIVVYGVLAVIYGYRRRYDLLQYPWACLCLAVGALFFGGMVFCDLLLISATLEESLKIVAAMLILCALLSVQGGATAHEPSPQFPETKENVL